MTIAYTALTIETEPAIEPVTLNEVKAQLRVTDNKQNEPISNLITTVRRHAEKLLGRALITQTWTVFFADWPDGDCFEIPRPPLQTISSIKYKDVDGDQTTWSTDYYIVDIDSDPGLVTLGYEKSWPSSALYPSNPIEIEFIAGYGLTVATVPEDIRTMIKIGIERMFIRPTDSYDKLLRDIWSDFLWNNRIF